MSLNEGLGAGLAWGADPVAALHSPRRLHTLWSVFMVYLPQHGLGILAWSCHGDLSTWVIAFSC